MKKFTKILSLLLCLAMIFSFAACTGKDRRQRNNHGRDCSGGHNDYKYHDPQGSDRHGHG